MAAVPSDCVWAEDNTNVAALDAGFSVYAGYYNGPFANMTALKARFPHQYLISIATRFAGSAGSMTADVEPGTLSATQAGNYSECLAWLKQGGFSGHVPLVYVMASWAKDLELYLKANGISRTSYYLWTAHYIGQHLCSPAGCGYGNSQADATQYATGVNDYDVFRGYVVAPTVVAVTPPAATDLTLGSTGAEVKTVQIEVNYWASVLGIGALIVDGDFGGKTYAAVMAFQKYEKVTADGIVGPVTSALLQKKPPVKIVTPAPAPPVLPSGNPLLKFGDVSKQVAAMQYYLRNSGLRGVRGIEADGDFGSQTETAVRNFQVHASLSVDGVYGPATAKALVKYAVH